MHVYVHVCVAGALKKLQGAELDGHKLQLKLSSRTAADTSADSDHASATAAKGGKKGSKVCVPRLSLICDVTLSYVP